MTTCQLHSTVARITGDALATINRLGFGLHHGRHDKPERDNPLTVLDCPCCGNPIILASDADQPLPRYAECSRCDSVVSYSRREPYQTDLDDIVIPPEPERFLVPAA